jgi:hypothetical protein
MTWLIGLAILLATSTSVLIILVIQSDREFEKEQRMDSAPADTTGPISAEFLARFHGSTQPEFENSMREAA